MVETSEKLKEVFSDESAANILLESGFTKPVDINYKEKIITCIVDYNCMLKVKGAMDQFLDGMCTFQVNTLVKEYPTEMKQFFVNSGHHASAGMVVFTMAPAYTCRLPSFCRRTAVIVGD